MNEYIFVFLRLKKWDTINLDTIHTYEKEEFIM